MNRATAIRESVGDRVFLALIYIFLCCVLVAVLYPLIYIVSSSFSSAQAVVSGEVWLWPVDFSLMGYKVIFSNPAILTGYMNSIIYTLLGVSINVVMTVAIAYPLSRSTFVGRNLIMMLLVFTILFSGGLIPTYLTVKAVGILDTRWAMVLPGALSVFQVIVARTFFQSTIPKELGEAAELDGCSDIGFLWRIVLPLSKAIIAVLILFYAVGIWNAYFDALIYLKSPELYPLQIILRNILILNTIDATALVDANQMAARQGLRDLLKYSLIVVATVPILCIYPFVQKYFVQGIMIGSVKG
ncbi:carbohydrate ABC transporter permease [Cohnella thailandensis]|uniref:Carbohydrate ABC transporter permease n=1 Tax=Cohnella thailandensis TaxID=557557 RepID=A0A841SRS1_9BACL|nr:carbohydrate ABC transporter permease [Cohnella thailandensis]MBB6632888.1 carbohydrate ABC transporter permease [Cohnella thailandensis]MBP1975418.1 putative aldouronate transport system permease protein [Cohnella thailandensis]